MAAPLPQPERPSRPASPAQRRSRQRQHLAALALHQHVSRALRPGDGLCCDVAVAAFGRMYRLHKLVLVQAGFFHDLFTGSFSETAPVPRPPAAAGGSALSLQAIPLYFPDPNISRPAFEYCLATLYGSAPELRLPSWANPRVDAPLSAAFPAPISPAPRAPPDIQPATPRFLLSLVATSTYLGLPSVTSLALTLILASMTPYTVATYLRFATGLGIVPVSSSSPVGPMPTDILAAPLVGWDGLSSPASPDDSVEPNPVAARAETSPTCTFPFSNPATATATSTARGSGLSSAPPSTHTFAPALSKTPSSAGLLYCYGPSTEKVGEAAVCWLCRWGADILEWEFQQTKSRTDSLPPATLHMSAPLSSSSSWNLSPSSSPSWKPSPSPVLTRQQPDLSLPPIRPLTFPRLPSMPASSNPSSGPDSGSSGDSSNDGGGEGEAEGDGEGEGEGENDWGSGSGSGSDERVESNMSEARRRHATSPGSTHSGSSLLAALGGRQTPVAETAGPGLSLDLNSAEEPADLLDPSGNAGDHRHSVDAGMYECPPPLPVIWAYNPRLGLPSSTVRQIVSSDSFFVKSESVRYTFACRLVEYRRWTKDLFMAQDQTQDRAHTQPQAQAQAQASPSASTIPASPRSSHHLRSPRQDHRADSETTVGDDTPGRKRHSGQAGESANKSNGDSTAETSLNSPSRHTRSSTYISGLTSETAREHHEHEDEGENEESEDEDETEYRYLFAHGIYYTHMDFFELSIMEDTISPTTGEPYTPRDVLQRGLWSGMELRSLIVKTSHEMGRESEQLELSLPVKAFRPGVENQRRLPLLKENDTARRTFHSWTPFPTRAKSEKRYFPVPADETLKLGDNLGSLISSSQTVRDCLSQSHVDLNSVLADPGKGAGSVSGLAAVKDLYSLSLPSSDHDFDPDLNPLPHYPSWWGVRGRSLQGHELKKLCGRLLADKQAKAATQTETRHLQRNDGCPWRPSGAEENKLQEEEDDKSHSADKIDRSLSEMWAPFEPMRIGVDFWGVDKLAERNRLYSPTWFYAGSLWNLYVVTVRKSKGVQLGIYLHRQNPAENVPPASAPPPGSGTNEDQEGNKGKSPSAGGGDSMSREVGWSYAELFAALHLNREMPGNTSGSGATGGGDVSATPAVAPAAGGTGTGEEGGPRLVPCRCPHMPYTDPRKSVRAFFSIHCPAPLGNALTRFSSGPDQFTLGQSWGWKSSSLLGTLSLPEGTLEDARSDSANRFRCVCTMGLV